MPAEQAAEHTHDLLGATLRDADGCAVCTVREIYLDPVDRNVVWARLRRHERVRLPTDPLPPALGNLRPLPPGGSALAVGRRDSSGGEPTDRHRLSDQPLD